MATYNFKKDSLINIGTLRLVFIAICVGVFNVTFIFNSTAAYFVIALELIVLLFYLIKKKMVDYIGFYMIFLSLSVEFNTFVGSDTFYSFKNIRAFGINLGILCLLPIVFIGLIKIRILLKTIKRLPKFYYFIKWLMILNVTGILVGLLVIMINDNGIQSLPSLISSFVSEIYSLIIYPWLLIISLLYLLAFEENKIYKLKNYIFATFIGIAFSVLYSYFSGSIGYYAGVETLLVSSGNFLLPFIIMYPFYIKSHQPWLILGLGITSTLLILSYNANGKIIILSIMLPLIFLSRLWNKKNKVVFVFLFPIIVIILISIIFIISNMTNNSVLLESKFNQAISLLSIWDKDWLLNLPASPKYRISEFLNTLLEFSNKPIYFITGKGYLGTIKDYVQAFGQPYEEGTFTNGEWTIRSFYGMHETLNTLFLCSGIPGLIFYFYMLKEYVKNLNKSFFYLVGGYWFLLFYGYSVTISSLGLVCIFVGMVDIKQDVKEIKIYGN